MVILMLAGMTHTCGSGGWGGVLRAYINLGTMCCSVLRSVVVHTEHMHTPPPPRPPGCVDAHTPPPSLTVLPHPSCPI